MGSYTAEWYGFEVKSRRHLMDLYIEPSFAPAICLQFHEMPNGGYRAFYNYQPARKEEVEHAEEEGIKFAFLHNPVEVEGENGWVKAVRCQVMELSDPDESGRRKPVPVEGKFITVPCDCMIMSIGTSPNPLIKSTTEGLETQKWGGIVADEATGLTSRKGVYAGGDAVTGAATVILAMGAGKTAAAAIDADLSGK